jgi:hypothetical protein
MSYPSLSRPCMLFNAALKKAKEASGIKKEVRYITYAEDIDIIGRTERAVREEFGDLERTAREM